MNISEAIVYLDQQVTDPSEGLPEEIFLYVSRITPLINVDLLIQDENGRTLLSWRDERYTGVGWHVPGGIVRFKETLETRIKKVAETEIGADLSYDPIPMAINQLIHPEQNIRGHFISVLYQCFLESTFIPENFGRSSNDNGYIAWHETCPNPLLSFHEIYRKYMGESLGTGRKADRRVGSE